MALKTASIHVILSPLLKNSISLSFSSQIYTLNKLLNGATVENKAARFFDKINSLNPCTYSML
jgi:hypothetical protein